MAVYYVDFTTGDDADTGLSEALAWKTIAKVNAVFNAVGFSPDDQILFKRGETWDHDTNSGLIIRKCSGTSGHPIIIGAYGSGNKPYFTGWHDGTSGIVCWEPGNYITIQDLHIGTISGGGWGIAITGGNQNHVRVLRCDVDNITGGAGNGIVFNEFGDNYEVSDCTIDTCGNSGIVILGDDVYHPTNGLIHGNTVHDCAQDGIVLHYEEGELGATHVISNNVCYNCGEQGIDVITGSAVTITGNETYNNTTCGVIIGTSVTGTISNVTIEKHYSHDEATGIYLQYCSDIHIHYSILKNSSRNIRVDAEVSGLDVYNNVLYATGAAYNIYFSAATGGGVRNIKNNIFWGDDFDHRYLYCVAGADPTDTSSTFDYNCYWRVTGGPDDDNWWLIADAPGSSTWSAWRTNWGQDAHSQWADPLCISTTDFHLQGISPCLDAGLDVGLTSDYEGNPIVGAEDMGAYEYQDVPVPSYYVDFTLGDDDNLGTTEALAWKTIAKVNASSFAPRTNILFKRGETWRETLIPPSAGTAGNQITFGAYGTGNDPVISGADAGAPTTPVRDYCIYDSTGKGYITIDGLAITYSAKQGIKHNYYIVSEEGSTPNWIVQNCTLTYCGMTLFGPNTIVQDNTVVGPSALASGISEGAIFIRGAVASNCSVLRNTVHDYNSRGIWFMDTTDTPIANDNIVYNIAYTKGGTGEGYGIDFDGFSEPITGMVTAVGNTVYDCARWGIYLENCSEGSDISKNLIYNCTNSAIAFQNNGAEVGNHIGALASYNVIYGCGKGIYTLYVSEVNIWNNVIDAGSGALKFGVVVTGSAANSHDINIRNNIFGSDLTAVCLISNEADWTDCISEFDYNAVENIMIMYENWSTELTLADLQGAGRALNCFTTDPGFVNAVGHDYHLLPDSPCINAGVDVGLTEDFEGNGIW